MYVCSRVGRGGAFFALPVATSRNPLKTNDTEVTDGNDWGLDMVVVVVYVVVRRDIGGGGMAACGMRLRKVKIKNEAVGPTDWGSIWDLFHSIVGEARDRKEVWRCEKPGKHGFCYTFWRVKSEVE